MRQLLPKPNANFFFRLGAVRPVALALLLGLVNLFLPLQATAGPANDNLAYAAVASGTSVTLTGSNVGATKETGEPNHAGNAGGKSAWWTWTAPSAGTVTITTFGSSIDTLLGVYVGTSVSGLTAVASNDDSGSLQSRVAFTAVAGTSYRIAVDGYNGASGNITLNISQTTSTSCSYSISQTSASVGSTSSSGSVSVTTTSGCTWSASSGAAWITITSGSSGSGNGTVYYSVAANTSTGSRTGTLTIAGKTFTVSQAAAPTIGCTYSISGSTASYGSAGGSGSVPVTTGSGCAWTASSGVSWVAISSGASGTGNGNVNYYVAANTGSSRSGTLTIAGRSFTISQTGATADTAPTASLTSPGNGATISGTATFTGTATDDVGVTKVEFWCDGSVLIGTATTAPYSIAWNTASAANGSHSFTCKAYDGAGHSTGSAANTVTVSNSTGSLGQFQMAKTAIAQQSSANSVAVDRSGNVVAVGTFRGSVDFGSGALSSLGTDNFVVKYNAQGGLVWVKRIGGSSDDDIQGVAIDSADNIIVVGSFNGTVDFGGGPITSTMGLNAFTGTYMPTVDIFVAKYSASGSLLWVKGFGGTQTDSGRGVAVDANGNVFFAARFGSSSIVFANTTVNNGAGSGDFALVKLAAGDGSVMWANGWGGSGANTPYGVAVDRSGDLLVTGSFYGSTDLGGGQKNSAGGYDIFVAKYSGLDGSYRWARTMGSSSAASESGNAIATDPNTGNVIVTGAYAGAVDFGGPIMDYYGNANNVGGVFLAAYDSNGNYLWARSPNSAVFGFSDECGYGLKVDASGKIYVTGKVNASIYLGGSQSLGGGRGDSFIASLSSSGMCQWAKRSGGASGVGLGIALDNNGHVVTAGRVSNSVMYFDATLGAAGGSVDAAGYTSVPFVAQFMK